MSSAITVHGPGRERGRPPGRRLKRLASFVLALVLGLGTLFLATEPAHAGSFGVGFHGDGGFLGAYNTDLGGRQAYCIDLGAPYPFDQTSGPDTVTSLDGLSGQPLAELNYTLARWGQSDDPNLTAAVALFTWSVADGADYVSHGGDDFYVTRAPVENRPIILGNLAMMRQEASANAVVAPSLSLSIAMADQYAGTLTIGANPASVHGTVSLSGAVFSDGSTSGTRGTGQFAITGTPPDGAPSYQIGASMDVDAAGYGAKVDLYTTGDAQRIIAAGSSTGMSAQTQGPVIDLDFQPVIATQVASRFVAEGDVFVDRLSVGVTKGTWTTIDGNPVPVIAKGTLFGPFDEQPAESDAPPPGAPVVGTEQLTLTGAGDYSSAGTIAAPESGFYVWLWQIEKAAQGENARYLTDSFADRFGRVAETSVTPFQPVAVSTADQRLVVPGEAVTDTIVVSSDNGAWLRRDGADIPVVFEGTAYQVPGTRPPLESAAVDPAAVQVGTVTITANGPGTYTSPEIVLPRGGFVTWVWQVRKAAQPEAVRDYLAADWSDRYGIPVESSSVRWPIQTTSLMREYNVHPQGRAFDTVTVTGFPADHGTFAGDGYWQADVDELVHTVYGPVASDSELTDDVDLSTLPVLTTITTPARNGVYKLGYADADRITPTAPGYYVLVTTFAGDDRVQPYASSPADILERFFVPPTPTPPTPLSVITQATPNADVGQPFDDTALVQGTDIPAGSYLVFRAYGPHPADAAAVCETPFFESSQIPVSQAGVYRSGTTSVTGAGAVYWVETLYDHAGMVLASGGCGAPGETTIVSAPATLTVTTRATAAGVLGQPATDTAIVAGAVPEGATVTFDAYRQAGTAPACTDAERVFTSAPVPLNGPGEYTSEPVVFDTIGVYYWIETVHDREGRVIGQGQCGAPGETTTVTAVPAPLPPTLAATGGGDWVFPVGIAAGVFALAGLMTLWFGRKLALARERAGYVREEDRGAEELEDLFKE